MGELVRYEVTSGVARLVLDSPHNRNALSSQLQAELNAHLHEALDNTAVRVIVLTATGDVFCSGADLKEQRERTVSLGPEVAIDTLTSIWHSPKPVLGRINGHTRAGGLGLVGACDIAIAPEWASFGFAEVRIGVLPAVISVTCLPRMSNRAALELFLTGENLGAHRAVEVGLLNRAVPGDALDDEVDRYVEMLRRGGPDALAGMKPMIERVRHLPMDAAFAEMLELSLSRFRSDEAGEGMRAFAEKRAPRWVEG